MSYTKHNWVNGEIITDEKLNHMEDGIGQPIGWDRIDDSVKSHGLMYITDEPTADNYDGGLKLVVLDHEPEVRYEGYIYIIVEA